MSLVESIKSQPWYFYLALFVLLLYLLPFAVLGEDSKIVVHDGLDGVHTQNVVLAGKTHEQECVDWKLPYVGCNG